ncbi:unnamed protein product [Chironomus riparius]|uniref:Carbohydrate sulfotransferase n=1 Tax=Chironomus riparius TaxID=315576 RepID=A0A9N9RJH2_9DIPT|nr:unnamed protein product [Chironomus riparius]
MLMFPRKIKMLLNKKGLTLVKAAVLIFVISIYLIVLVRESMNAMNNNAKYKTVLKVDKFKENSNHPRYDHKQNSDTKRKFKPPSSYLKPNQKFHNVAEFKSSLENSKTELDNSSITNSIYEYSEEINAKAENDFNGRKEHLWKVCAKNNIIGKLTPNAWEFFISAGHGIAWCNVFKAASTTWMYYLNILAGYDLKYLQRTVATPLELARKRFPRPSLEDLYESLENSISFLIVREPFERLLSAYRNKMEEGRNNYYKLLGDQIVKRFRGQQPLKNDPSGPTFKEFLQFVVQHYKSGGRFDEHWSPIYQFCTPCSINFTLIAKMETFDRDSEYIIRQAGLETLLLNKVPNTKVSKISNRSKNNTASLISRYFSQIDRHLLEDILEIYQLDFDLFNYNSSKYWKIVQQKSDKDINNRLDFESGI